MPKYLFDTNIFLQAKNLYYQFGFCGGFWDWIVAGHDKKMFFSCKKVYAELAIGNDRDTAKSWAKDVPNGFFLDDINDPSVMAVYAELMNWSYGSVHYSQSAKDEFAGKNEADAFLLSVAKRYGYSIVTQEKPNPAQKNRIPLPDAAKQFGVPTIFIYDLLAKHAVSTFQLQT